MTSKVDDQGQCSINIIPIKSSVCKMKNKGKKPWKKLGPANIAPTTTKKTFRAPTKGYKDVLFTSGKSKDAAQFTDMIEQLLRYVDTSGWKKASELAKVMTDLKDPALVAPARPTIMYLCRLGPDVVETKNRITLGVVKHPNGRQHRLPGHNV